MNVRKITKADIPKAVEIAKTNWPGDKRVAESCPLELEEMFSTARWRPTYYVAEVGSEIVGFAGWNYSWANYDIYEFSWCNVLKEYRGKGFGRALVEKRIEDIRKEARPASLVLCSTHHPQIYERYGFRVISKHKMWEPEGNTNLMILDIKGEYNG